MPHPGVQSLTINGPTRPDQATAQVAATKSGPPDPNDYHPTGTRSPGLKTDLHTMTSFVQAYRELPPELREVLLGYDIEPLRTCADVYKEIYEEHSGPLTIATEAANRTKQPSSVQHYTSLLSRLYCIACNIIRRRTSITLTLHMMEDENDRQRESNNPDRLSVTRKAKANWRHWNPRNTNMDPATKRGVEDSLKTQWANYTIDILLPICKCLPYMHKHRGHNERLKWRSLLGNTRWSTIKHHALVYVQILRFLGGPWLPHLDTKIADHIVSYKDQRRTAHQLRNFWNTTKFYCRIFGLPQPADQHDVKSMYLSTLDDIIVIQKRNPRKAIMPTTECIEALETTATDTTQPVTTRYAASTFRWALGSSARYDDVQHTAPNTIVATHATLEGKPWQTKSLSRTSTTDHKVLISTKHSFTGKRWWDIFERVNRQFLVHRPHMDYTLPQPTSLYTAFLDRPCTYYAALNWLRHILHKRHVDPEIVKRITLHSLRLWMAEMAYRAKIPRDRRRYIGQWAQEATSDVYTREHRQVCTEIWQEVTDKMHELHHVTQPEEKPTDLDCDYYMENAPTSSNTDDSTASASTSDIPYTDSYAKKLGGPLTVAINTRPTGRGSDRVRRIHFFRQNHTALCNSSYTYKASSCAVISNPDDWKDSIAETIQTPDGPLHYNKLCTLCARQAKVPKHWTTDDRESDDEPDDDSAATASERLSAATNDSDSEAEALMLDDAELV